MIFIITKPFPIFQTKNVLYNEPWLFLSGPLQEKAHLQNIHTCIFPPLHCTLRVHSHTHPATRRTAEKIVRKINVTRSSRPNERLLVAASVRRRIYTLALRSPSQHGFFAGRAFLSLSLPGEEFHRWCGMHAVGPENTGRKRVRERERAPNVGSIFHLLRVLKLGRVGMFWWMHARIIT